MERLVWTENMEWIHEHACSEYVQAIVKVYKHMCTTIFNKTQRQYSEHQYVHMMMSMRLNTCMETIRRNNSWNISRSVVVDDAKMLVLYALITWSGYMNKDAVNTCKQWWKNTCMCLLQFKKNDNVVCNSMCTWWWVCAWILAWKQFMEHQSIGCRRRCT